MLRTGISVQEIARISGLAVDAAWDHVCVEHPDARTDLWCAPGYQAGQLLDAAPSSLPAMNAVRVESRLGPIHWDAELPISIDLHWLREITAGLPLGTSPVRTWPDRVAIAPVRIHGGFIGAVWRDAYERTRVHVIQPNGVASKVQVASVASRSFSELSGLDELPRAMTGTTSVEWLRGVFAESCSPRWHEMARRIGARVDQLDDLGTHFQRLTTTEEDALWRAAATLESLQSLQPWVSALEPGQEAAFHDLLRDELDWAGAAFWRSPAGEWLSAIAGPAGAGLASLEGDPEALVRLRGPAHRLNSLLIRSGLAQLLVRLRAEAEREWTQLARWYRLRIEESCGALSPGAGQAMLPQSISGWMRKLTQRLNGEAERMAVERVRAQLSAVLAAEGPGGLLADLSFDLTAQGNMAVERVLTGDWRPCFEPARGLSASGLRWTGGALRGVTGCRWAVEVQLPFLSRAAWKTDRESLAGAPIQPSGETMLTLPAPDGNALRHTAALLLGAVFTARGEAPADDMIHLAHEHRRTLQGDASDALWRRLVQAYGVSAPDRTAAASQAALRVEIPWHWAEAWCDAPVKRNAGYVDRFLQLSLTLQEMTRHWLPVLCLDPAGSFEAVNSTLPMLVYAASQPYIDRKQAELGYPVMSLPMVQKAAASALPRLPSILAPIHDSLRAADQTKTAESYHPERARLIISAVQRKPRELARLLAGDAFLLEYGFQVAGMCRELRGHSRRNPVRALRKLVQFSGEIVKAFHKGTRQFYAGEAGREISTIYLIEATRVLAGGSPENGMRATLTVQADSGEWRVPAAA